MRDMERVKRANRILIGIVILFLLYGIFYRMQTGDNSLYLFGHRIELPFGGQETTENREAEETGAVQETDGEDTRGE